MYKIAITGLKVHGYHGVFDFERQYGQDFFIDAWVLLAGDAAAVGDNLANTVHYGNLADAIVENVKHNPVDLIETLAQRLLDLVFNFGGGVVHEAEVTVHKPNAPIPHEFADVSVTVRAVR